MAVKDKILDMEELLPLIKEERSLNKSIVFTNGCFDIIHPGHVLYLEDAKSEGDILVVGINDDDSVRTLNKGDGRPYQDLESRMLVLASLESVDYVCPFAEQTPIDLIRNINPDVLIKGGDYDETEEDAESPGYIVGSAEVRSNGGQVITIPFVEGHSTTSILKRIQG